MLKITSSLPETGHPSILLPRLVIYYFVLRVVKLIFSTPEFSGSEIKFSKKYRKQLKTAENTNFSRVCNSLLLPENSVVKNINFTTPRKKNIVHNSGIKRFPFPNDDRLIQGLKPYFMPQLYNILFLTQTKNNFRPFPKLFKQC